MTDKPTLLNERREPLTLSGPLTEADTPWLTALGARCIDSDLAAWLTGLNRLAEEGGVRAHKSPDVVAARERFLDHFTILSSNARSTFVEKVVANMPTSTVIAAQRSLYNYGLDSKHMLRKWIHVLTYSARDIAECVENLAALGLNPRKVLHDNPSVLGYSPQSATAKVKHLANLGIDGVRAINTQPRVLSCAPETITRRLEQLTTCGFDAAAMVHRNPTCLLYSEETVRRRLVLLHSAARAWGVDRAVAIQIIQDRPSLLCYKADRIRTVIRLVSHAIPVREEEQLTPSHVGNIVAKPLEGLLFAYFHDRARQRKDLRRCAEGYAKEKHAAELQRILEQHREHPVLRFYWRTYSARSASP